MTMTRNEKTGHQAVMTSTGRRGYTEVRFASPKLVFAARAERGHDFMTRAEYREHRMGRGTAHECRIDLTISSRAERLSSQRVYGNGRRQTGRASVALRNLMTRGYVERTTRRAA
jgi:hypothetical protein